MPADNHATPGLVKYKFGEIRDKAHMLAATMATNATGGTLSSSAFMTSSLMLKQQLDRVPRYCKKVRSRKPRLQTAIGTLSKFKLNKSLANFFGSLHVIA